MAWDAVPNPRISECQPSGAPGAPTLRCSSRTGLTASFISEPDLLYRLERRNPAFWASLSVRKQNSGFVLE